MTDMNGLENVELCALHRPTKIAFPVALSGPPGDRVPGVYRVDPPQGYDLEDFELWTCRRSKHTPEVQLKVHIADVVAIYS